MPIVPRAKIGLKYSSLVSLIFNLFKKLPEKESEDIISDFESKFGACYNLPQAVVFNRARMAFYFLLKNLNLRQGGEVIISAIHIADFVNIIHCAGFKPVAVDLSKDTCAIDYQDLEKKITDKTVLMCITHLSGLATDMDRISAISQKYHIPFIEDCSQAVNSYYQRKKLCTFGRAGIFSLCLLKPVDTMTGGVVISQDSQLLEKLRKERLQLQDGPKLLLIGQAVKHLVYKTVTQKWLFIIFVFPFLRLFPALFDFFARYQRTNKNVVLRKVLPQDFFVKYYWQQAKLGLELLDAMEAREEKRREAAYFLYRNISNKNIKKAELLEGSRASFWNFPVQTQKPIHFKKYLLKHGIDSSITLLSVLGEEPEFACFDFKTPVASSIKKDTILLPMYPELNQDETDYMVKVINKYTPDAF